jgi:uncharacterized protein YkwD
MVGVCGDGFKMTEFPARRAGIKEFTNIKYGYYTASAAAFDWWIRTDSHSMQTGSELALQAPFE